MSDTLLLSLLLPLLVCDWWQFFFAFRWNGYNVQDYKKVVDEYNKLEMVGFHSPYSLSVILFD